MAEDEYKCAVCGNIYKKSPDEEAEKEAEELWGVKNASEDSSMAIICDDCFNNRTPEERKEMGNEYKDINLKNEI